MFNVTVLLCLSNHTIVMLSAIRELADKKDFSQCHSATTEYVEACNNLFERGVLSHKMVTHPQSEVLAIFSRDISISKQLALVCYLYTHTLPIDVHLGVI